MYKEGDELATKFGVSKKAGEDIKPSEPLIVFRIEVLLLYTALLCFVLLFSSLLYVKSSLHLNEYFSSYYPYTTTE